MTDQQQQLQASEIDEAPWNAYTWDGTTHSIGGVSETIPKLEDVDAVIYHGRTPEDWDGMEAAVVRLKDGRLAAWESVWGPTGSGFCEDAYGGDAEVWFAPVSELRTLLLQALTDKGRDVCGIPREGLNHGG